MKTFCLAVLLTLLCCTIAFSQVKRKTSEAPETPYLRVIDAKCKELAKIGRVGKGFDCAELIGQYEWHGDQNRYFGTYSFYKPAFEQAKRGWWGLHGKVIEGSDELWVEDNSISSWCGATSSNCGRDYPIKFDQTVIGRTISTMFMDWADPSGKFQGGEFQAKVIAIIDGGANLKLDKRAPHHAEQWNMSIAPDDYQDMCQCTNNFGPYFVNGQPVVQP